MDQEYRDEFGEVYKYHQVFRKLEDNELYAVKRMDCECVEMIRVVTI